MAVGIVLQDKVPSPSRGWQRIKDDGLCSDAGWSRKDGWGIASEGSQDSAATGAPRNTLEAYRDIRSVCRRLGEDDDLKSMLLLLS